MSFAVIYDCEFLTVPGAPMWFWCGPNDPDPLCVQIGAVRLQRQAPFEVSAPVGWYVQPKDRDGRIVTVDPLLTQLGGITDAQLAQEGLPLCQVLEALDAYSAGTLLLSWGKDDLLTLPASLFVQGVASPIPAWRFRNGTPLLLEAGETAQIVHGLRSNTICDHCGLDAPGPAHHARAYPAGVATAFQHLLQAGRLRPEHIAGLAE